MPPKVKCFTKATNEGKPYTTCLQGEKQLRDGEAPKKTYPYIKKGKATKVSVPAKKASMPTKVAPKPRVPSKAKIIKAVEAAPSIGKKLTGLTAAEMNKMTPLELFGLLPKELGKKVLDPKTTGVQVGGIPISKITEGDLEIYDLVPEEEDSNYNESMLYMNDYTDVMSRSQSDWYLKANRKGYYDLSEASQVKYEKLEGKIMDGIRRLLSKQHTRIFRDWKKANKGKISSLKNWKKSFESYYESHN